MSALTTGDTALPERVTVDREAFRRLCVEAGGAIGALRVCSSHFASMSGAAGSSTATAKACDDLRAALSAAVASARPA